MKQTILYFALALLLFNCNKEESKPDYAIISGIIKNKPSENLTINSFDRSFSEILEVNEAGEFVDTLDTNISQYVLYDGTNPVFLYIDKGYDLNINYDASDFENSLQITGTGSAANNYLIAKRKIERENFGNFGETYGLSEADYKTKIALIRSKQDSLLRASKVPEEFLKKEEREIHYTYLNYLTNYERSHQYVTKNQEFKVAEEFLKELDGLDYNNESDYSYSNSYKALLNNYYQKESNKLVEQDSLEFDIAYLNTISKIENETIRNGMLFDFAQMSLGYSKDVDSFYKLYIKHSTNNDNNKIIEESYNKLQALKSGSPSPVFVNYQNYEGGETSLKDLKGKYVYVDVWATWCGPCIREIPSLKEVEAKYHDNNIEFVSISIDKASDNQKWKDMVAEKELGGIQLFADNDWNSQFVKDYQIQGIPRFILIDPQGNIVDSNAPRPSSPELIELFESLEI